VSRISAELAALYCIAIALNHPFLDGNKRTAYVALETFLVLNGYRLQVTDADAVVMTVAMASGEVRDARVYRLGTREHRSNLKTNAHDPASGRRRPPAAHIPFRPFRIRPKSPCRCKSVINAVAMRPITAQPSM